MSKPVYNAIIEYARLHTARFHMPSHGGENLDGAVFASAAFDITELPFSDNLLYADGIIAESERNCARAYGAHASLYFTAGATSAIFTAIGAARQNGDTLIIQRSSHKSVYAAARFFGFATEYIAPRFRDGVPQPVTAEEVAAAIKRCPSAAAVVVTSPDYFGQTANAREISSAVRGAGKLLICDSSHGAHFPFGAELPEGFSRYADMEAVSFHKSMPVYSGGAALNVNDSELEKRCRLLRADLHTTSPSYLTMASMDYAVDELSRYGEVLYEKLKNRVDRFKSRLPAYEFLDNDDFSRLVITLGGRLISKLYDNKIVAEATYGDKAVFIVTPYNMQNLDAVEGVLKDETPTAEPFGQIVFPEPRRGKTGDGYEFVDLKDAIGRTSCGELGIYPPGIPLVARGEVITEDIARLLQNNNAFGFLFGKICVII